MGSAGLETEDQLAIQQLYARQSHAIDAGDAEGWAACFTEDGTFESPTYERGFAGASELTAFAAEFALAAAAANLVRRHWTTALVLDAESEDRVAGRCYALVLATAPGEPPRIERSVVFHDRLRRHDGRWRFESRRVEVDGRIA